MARISLSLLVACFLLLASAAATASRPAPSSSTATATISSFVRTWCAGTEYPTLCDATLSPYSSTVGTSPARLAWAALTVTLSAARNATAAMKSMASRGSSHNNNLPPVAAEAAGDCASMLGDGADALRRCVDAMDRVAAAEKGTESSAAARRKARFEVDNVRTWASAALTDDDMCMEGFRGAAAGGVREVVRGHVMGVVHLTANALGIVDAMSKQTPP